MQLLRGSCDADRHPRLAGYGMRHCREEVPCFDRDDGSFCECAYRYHRACWLFEAIRADMIGEIIESESLSRPWVSIYTHPIFTWLCAGGCGARGEAWSRAFGKPHYPDEWASFIGDDSRIRAICPVCARIAKTTEGVP